MTKVAARAMRGPEDTFETMLIDRRELGPEDIYIEIAYAGICHSDVHHARADWGHTMYPIVPGHEIAGVVTAVGSAVTKFAIGDRAGIGCMVDSCRKCDYCRAGLEQYCREGHVLAYNMIDREGRRTFGGYSESIVVDQAFAVKIPGNIPLEQAAPLMCGGITLYSPLRHWSAGPGKRVGIIGFGGLGHIGTQISSALGAHTIVFNLNPAAREDALRLGADEFRTTTEPNAFDGLEGSLDLIISTVPAKLDLDAYLRLLDVDGTFVNLGVPVEPLSIVPHSLLINRRSIAGSSIGGIAETQEMIDFCAAKGIGAQVEVIDANSIDDAYDRLSRGDVRYRFVIDTSTIRANAETPVIAEHAAI
ncbi:NAD(P)-dependent alcohol dehydrogenase [Arthrobacter sp. FW306-04-A]|uniref:NAD(P)-dependent alcohol dehydrogenase n=1 Tax=Arthrobacter sp. FW306-04-A TaxID=2879619 RepID=UPI0037C0C2A5